MYYCNLLRHILKPNIKQLQSVIGKENLIYSAEGQINVSMFTSPLSVVIFEIDLLVGCQDCGERGGTQMQISKPASFCFGLDQKEQTYSTRQEKKRRNKVGKLKCHDIT